MEGVLSDGMCRCCASEGSFKDFQVPYQWMGAEEIYANMLKDCFDLTLSISEEINNGGICEVCITQLRNACNFKRQVQKTEEKFKRKMEESSFKTDTIKMEVTRFDDDDSNMSADEFSSQEYEVPIKVEKLDEKPRKRQAAAKASTSKAKKSKASAETSVKRHRHQLLIKSEKNDAVKKILIDNKVRSDISCIENKNSDIYSMKGIAEDSTTNDPIPELASVKAKIHNTTIVKGLFNNVKPAPKAKNKIAQENVSIVKGSGHINKSPPNSKTTTVVKIKIIDQKSPPLTEKNMHINNLEVLIACSNATPIRSNDGFAYMCCFCNNNFVNPADLKTHTLSTHNNSDDIRDFMKKQRPSAFLMKLDITQLKCTVCNASIDGVEGLFDHLQQEHKKHLHKDVMNRIIPFKFGGEGLQCVICPSVFIKYKILLEHMHTHFRNHVCEICDCGFISRRALLNHRESHKTGSFECSKCDKVFENPQRRRTHFNAVHKFMNMPHKCGVCNERFKCILSKDRHMITMHGKSPVTLKCLACDKIFSTQNSLRLHRQNYHLMERRFQCTECEMNFFTSGGLKSHMLKHTGIKDFQCDVCLKWFTRKSVLREHMRIHANDRRFTCVHCGRGFVQKCSWRGHMRTVHGEIDSLNN